MRVAILKTDMAFHFVLFFNSSQHAIDQWSNWWVAFANLLCIYVVPFHSLVALCDYNLVNNRGFYVYAISNCHPNITH